MSSIVPHCESREAQRNCGQAISPSGVSVYMDIFCQQIPKKLGEKGPKQKTEAQKAKVMCHSKLVSDRIKTTTHDFWVYYMSRAYYITQIFPSVRREKGKQTFLQFHPTPTYCRVGESISWPCSQLSSCTLTSPKNTYPASKIPRVMPASRLLVSYPWMFLVINLNNKNTREEGWIRVGFPFPFRFS